VTYDGDVWLIKGLNQANLSAVSWERFASGLNEPLSIASVGGALQVHTRNGLVRLHDLDGNGEADWYENFSDAWAQSASSRAFALDMAVAADGSTFISQGGIGLGTPFAGAVTRISADGQEAKIISKRAREPYLALNPETGLLTATDQQGNYIPSSVCYLVKPGANFGFGEPQPAQLTAPLVWIPHHEDNSCASQLWLQGAGMGVFAGKLLHLSYGRGTPLLICPDLESPVPQGAVIPLGLQTEIPLLHARMHPSNRSFFACGFQIYDSRAAKNWGICRIRPSGVAPSTPVDARSCSDGVFLSFSAPLDPASVGQESIIAAAWNYKRSGEYGSGRFNRAGEPGIDPVPIGQVLLSADRKTVFIHLPGLAPVMQLEINHAFRFASGVKAEGKVYFTIHQPHVLDLASAGFKGVDLSQSVPIIRVPKAEPPTKQRGKELSVSMGCIACHSIDGSTEGKTGPTWKGLFGKDRVFTDGSIESANEFYIRASILEPEKKIVAGYHPGMASYKGILADDQVDSLILYIRSLSEN
jgi:cytochrome c2